MTAIKPPVYEWTATTAQEAENALTAARGLIDAHLQTLAPGAPVIRNSLRAETPAALTIRLDLTPLVSAINEVRQLNDALQLDTDQTDS